jgi:hypothetical protein
VTDRSEYARGPGRARPRPDLRVVGHDERVPRPDPEVAKRGIAACRQALKRAKWSDSSDESDASPDYEADR